MAVAEAHPSVEELTEFIRGTLDEETQAPIEAHVAACTSCQERAAVAPDDSFLELVRSVHAGMGGGVDTVAEAAAQVQTPVPPEAVEATDVFPPEVAPSAPAESDCPEVADALPPELAHHERYRVVRLLGKGGMGTVYEAEHRVMKRRVAVKVINPAYTGNAGILERFRREVHKAARLSHSNIVTTYDAEDAGETHFLVMEYIEGTDLGRLVQERGPLPVDRACDYIRQAALGLQHAFEQKMVHRDLKPQNLMRTPDDRVKILDFGLARFASEAADAAGLTSTGIVLGTVDYIAPEQADNAHQADIRSDIYSLGCTLYHLLAGQPPFPTGTPLQKVMAHAQKEPQPLTELRSDLPEGIMPVLERMMAKNPKRRYQTPAEVAIALEPFIRAIKPPPDRWRPRLMIATAALAFLIAGLLGVSVYRIATDTGELVIETGNEDVEVVVSKGGKEVKFIDTKSGKHVTLNSGDYELALKDGKDELKISPVKMTVKRGETVLATIERVSKPVAEKVGEVHRFEGAPGLCGIAISPDGRYLLSTGASIQLWDLHDRRYVRSFPGDGRVHAVSFSPDGSQFLSASNSGTIRRWDLKTGEQLGPPLGNHELFDVVYSPDGRKALFSCVSSPDYLQLLDVQRWKVLRSLRGHTAQYQRVAISPDGRRGLSAGGDGSVRLWDLDTGNQLRVIEGTGSAVAFSPDGLLALSGLWDNTIRLWEVETGKEVRRFQGHEDRVWGIAFSPDGRRALSGSSDKTVRLWDVATGRELHCFRGHQTQRVYSVLFTPDGRYGVSSGDGEAVRVWRLPDPPPAEKVGQVRPAEKVGEVRRFEGHTKGAWGVAFSPDGRYALSGAGDGTVRLWEVATGRELRQFPGHNRQVTDVAFLPDGRQALTTSCDGTVRLWDVETGKEIRVLKCPNEVHHVAFSSDGHRALSGGYDATILWDLENGKELRRFPGAIGVALSSDGRQALYGESSGDIGLWDAETGAAVRKFVGHRVDMSHYMVFMPGGRQMLSCGHDCTLRLWDVNNGKEIRRFSGHTGALYKVAVTPDGHYAVSGGLDKTVRVWDVQSGKELHCFTGHTEGVIGVAISPDGRYALSSSSDGTMRLWRLPELPVAKENP